MSSNTDRKIERVLEILADVGSGLEAIGFQLKRNAAEIAEPSAAKEAKPAAVSETTFSILLFEAQKGEKLGDFETASLKNNIPDKWNQAFNILRQSNATINSRYHGEGYICSYWIYGDRIFRQKLKPKA
jgi:hypothetical protein